MTTSVNRLMDDAAIFGLAVWKVGKTWQASVEMKDGSWTLVTSGKTPSLAIETALGRAATADDLDFG